MIIGQTGAVLAVGDFVCQGFGTSFCNVPDTGPLCARAVPLCQYFSTRLAQETLNETILLSVVLHVGLHAQETSLLRILPCTSGNWLFRASTQVQITERQPTHDKTFGTAGSEVNVAQKQRYEAKIGHFCFDSF